jgi:hypothetical protein
LVGISSKPISIRMFLNSFRTFIFMRCDHF